MSDIKNNDAVTANGNTVEITMSWLLNQVTTLQADTKHIDKAFEELAKTCNGGNSPKYLAISEVVKSRETTNQQLISFYSKIYDDLAIKSFVGNK